MARYIDESKLIQAIVKVRDTIPLTIPCASYELLDVNPNSVGQSQRAGIRKALRCIAEAPTADVVEVRHGEWMKEGCCFYCSECKKTYGFGSTQTIYDVKRHWLHCPHCGAKMDGGKNEQV